MSLTFVSDEPKGYRDTLQVNLAGLYSCSFRGGRAVHLTAKAILIPFLVPKEGAKMEHLPGSKIGPSPSLLSSQCYPRI